MQTLIDWFEGSIGVALLALICALPAYVALGRMSLPSRYGIDWGPRRKVVAFVLATLLVLGLVLIFSAVYNSSSSWDVWWD